MPHTLDRVELEYVEHRLLAGMVGGQPVEMAVEVPISTGTASGRCGEATVLASWHIASNYEAWEQSASLEATLGDETLSLAATIRFRSPTGPVLVSATISGRLAGETISVEVAPGVDHRAVIFQGHVGTLVLAGRANTQRGEGRLEGTVDDRPIKLTARHAATKDWMSPVTITGEWDAPPSLCLLAAAGLLFFV